MRPPWKLPVLTYLRCFPHRTDTFTLYFLKNEFALQRKSRRQSSYQPLRVHGHTTVQEKRVAEIYTVRLRRCHCCSYCKSDTFPRDLIVGDTFHDRRQPGHQDAAPVGSPTVHQPLDSSQPVPPSDFLDDSPLPNCAIRDIVITERDQQLLDDLRSASAMAIPRCIVSRYATAWAESLEGAISGHQSWAVLCRYRCRLLLAEVPRGSDRNAELKLWLQLREVGEVSEFIGRVLGQQHLRIDGQAIHQQSRERTRVWSSARLSRLSKELGYSLDSTELRLWNSSRQCRTHRGRVELGVVAGAKAARSAARGLGRSETGIASLRHVKLAPMSAPGPQGWAEATSVSRS